MHAGPVAPGRRKLKVLIVDDSNMNLTILKTMLARTGIAETVPAMNGQEALDILTAPDSPKFDMVLTDILLKPVTVESLRSLGERIT